MAVLSHDQMMRMLRGPIDALRPDGLRELSSCLRWNADTREEGDIKPTMLQAIWSGGLLLERGEKKKRGAGENPVTSVQYS